MSGNPYIHGMSALQKGYPMSQIVIVGSGVVGTATGKGFAKLDVPVKFVDVNPARVKALRSEGLDASIAIDLSEDSIIFLTLPTPSLGRGYDLSALVSGTASVGTAIKETSGFHTVVVRSTVPPGACEELVGPTLEEASGRTVGSGFALASAPEFLRAATALEDFLTPWMTVIASRSPGTVDRLAGLFKPFGGEMRTFDDPAVAEMIKCTHNVFNAAKISFWNENWVVCQRLGLNADHVASAVARSAEGSTNPLYGIRGGAPYGGACLPKEVAGFLGLGDALGINLPVVEGVSAMNEMISHLMADANHIEENLVVDSIRQIA
jgi:UDPglucose 6-dehydrogenase